MVIWGHIQEPPQGDGIQRWDTEMGYRAGTRANPNAITPQQARTAFARYCKKIDVTKEELAWNFGCISASQDNEQSQMLYACEVIATTKEPRTEATLRRQRKHFTVAAGLGRVVVEQAHRTRHAVFVAKEVGCLFLPGRLGAPLSVCGSRDAARAWRSGDAKSRIRDAFSKGIFRDSRRFRGYAPPAPRYLRKGLREQRLSLTEKDAFRIIFLFSLGFRGQLNVFNLCRAARNHARATTTCARHHVICQLL